MTAPIDISILRDVLRRFDEASASTGAVVLMPHECRRVGPIVRDAVALADERPAVVAALPGRLSAEDIMRGALDRAGHRWAFVFERSENGNLLRGAARVAARIVAWQAAREAGYSFPDIARSCGMTSHSTIVEALQGARRAIDSQSTESIKSNDVADSSATT